MNIPPPIVIRLKKNEFIGRQGNNRSIYLKKWFRKPVLVGTVQQRIDCQV